jgi:hypothetical protein
VEIVLFPKVQNSLEFWEQNYHSGCGKLCGNVENFVKICIDNVAFVVYNRSIINKKGVINDTRRIKEIRRGA